MSEAFNFDLSSLANLNFNSYDDEKPKKKKEKVQVTYMDVAGLVKRMQSTERFYFNIQREKDSLEALVQNPPNEGETFRLLSGRGGFSTCALICFIASREVIEDLYVNTFRIGLAQFDELDELHTAGRLMNAHFITSKLQRDTDRHYNYFGEISKKCEKNGWDLKVLDNHSKVVLCRTKNNYYVIETSSNLTDNPKMEQFCWENSSELYEWYEELLKELMTCSDGVRIDCGNKR